MTRLPIEVKEKAFSLRKKGHSLKEIAEKLNIAKSTASLWLTDVNLNEEAKERLRKRGVIGQYKAILIKKKKRQELLNQFIAEAKEGINKIPRSKELYRLLCALLYWCEGNKNDLTGVRFTNSDPKMVKSFLYFLRKGFDIDESKLRALIHLHEYHDEDEQINFWSEVSSIPKDKFNRSYRKPNTGKRIKKNYPGCIAISYYNAQLAKKLWAYYQKAQII